jgi:hypothetical protein
VPVTVQGDTRSDQPPTDSQFTVVGPCFFFFFTPSPPFPIVSWGRFRSHRVRVLSFWPSTSRWISLTRRFQFFLLCQVSSPNLINVLPCLVSGITSIIVLQCACDIHLHPSHVPTCFRCFTELSAGLSHENIAYCIYCPRPRESPLSIHRVSPLRTLPGEKTGKTFTFCKRRDRQVFPWASCTFRHIRSAQPLKILCSWCSALCTFLFG